MAIREDDKIYVFTGCSHLGAAAAARYAEDLFEADGIELLIGGFHLYKSPMEEVRAFIKVLDDLNVDKVAPLHCTGIEATFELRQAYGDRCLLLAIGDRYESKST